MELQSLLIQHKIKILHAGVVIFALIVANNIIKSQNQNVAVLNSQLAEESRKNEVLVNLSQIEKTLDDYKNFINKKDMTSLINTITDIAAETDIKIDFVKPLPKESTSVYDRYPFSLNFIISDYHKIGEFINRLERHPDIYFVDRVNIMPQEQPLGDYVMRSLKVDLLISTIIFKDR
ncbi:MAG: type 4a pilus biogenesis protein PilO [Candidatus Omnitrophica bacterium]|nr:type 4a pilus biogenesis protein PilO [Candidatus Omnitrophota bacterium]